MHSFARVFCRKLLAADQRVALRGLEGIKRELTATESARGGVRCFTTSITPSKALAGLPTKFYPIHKVNRGFAEALHLPPNPTTHISHVAALFASGASFLPRTARSGIAGLFPPILCAARRGLNSGPGAAGVAQRVFNPLSRAPAARSSYPNLSLLAPTVRRSFAASSAAVAGDSLAWVRGGPAAHRSVSSWLFFLSAWVFSMVVLGGVTRLTRSGLSMTDWRFVGGLPPMSEAEWVAEFDKYKQSPEFKRVNLGMKLEEFKFIYLMEYGHRMWGRALGVAFALPFLYFSARGYVTSRLAKRLLAIFALGGAQGFVGWWMVKSGLEEPRSETVVPRVSPYRLAAHLTSAFVIYSLLFWTALSVRAGAAAALTSTAAAALASSAGMAAGLAQARRLVHPVAGLVGLTALSGAFVAGNQAGLAYNTWPLMGDKWVPDGMLEMQPLLRNFFENTATVQFDHRLLAYTTLGTTVGLWVAMRGMPLPPNVRLLSHAMLALTSAQVTLGILTLLHHVPVSLGATHQAGALGLFAVLLTLIHAIKFHRLSQVAAVVPSAVVSPVILSTPVTQAAKAAPIPFSGIGVLAAPPSGVAARQMKGMHALTDQQGMASLFQKP